MIKHQNNSSKVRIEGGIKKGPFSLLAVKTEKKETLKTETRKNEKMSFLSKNNASGLHVPHNESPLSQTNNKLHTLETMVTPQHNETMDTGKIRKNQNFGPKIKILQMQKTTGDSNSPLSLKDDWPTSNSDRSGLQAHREMDNLDFEEKLLLTGKISNLSMDDDESHGNDHSYQIDSFSENRD